MCTEVVVYKVCSANYDDFVHAASVTIRAPENAVWYVDAAHGSDANDGFSWETAKQTIQGAIDGAVSNNVIIVTNGVYGPIATGGLYVRIESVNGPEQTVIDGGGTNQCALLDGWSYSAHEYLDGTMLKGFSLVNGLSHEGGGVYHGSLEDCILSNNRSGEGEDGYLDHYGCGGGAYESCLKNCLIERNYATQAGGGAYHCILDNCILRENRTGGLEKYEYEGEESWMCLGSGGGAALSILNYCTIISNKSEWIGGGAFDSQLFNCLVVGNDAFLGGGMGDRGCVPKLKSVLPGSGIEVEYDWWDYDYWMDEGKSCFAVNTTFVGNHALMNASVFAEQNDDLHFVDCIFADNVSEGVIALENILIRSSWDGSGDRFSANPADSVSNGSATLTNGDIFHWQNCCFYNNAGENWTGHDAGSVVADPRFVDAAHGDYRLLASSHCVDAGTNLTEISGHDTGRWGYTVDLDGPPRVVGRGVDMGCFELQQGGASASAMGYVGVYDGMGHSIEVTVSEPSSDARIEYATSAGGPWSEVKPLFTNVCNETVWYVVSAHGYLPVTNSATVVIGMATVAPPTIAAKPYTGALQAADVPDGPWMVTYNMGGVNVNTYMVMLTLADSANYRWSTTDADYVMLDFAISSTENVWTVEPSIVGWTYGGPASVPVAESKFGTVAVRYRGTTAAGAEVANALAVTEAGSYVAVFSVSGTTDYGALSREVPFTVGKASIHFDPDDPNPSGAASDHAHRADQVEDVRRQGADVRGGGCHDWQRGLRRGRGVYALQLRVHYRGGADGGDVLHRGRHGADGRL